MGIRHMFLFLGIVAQVSGYCRVNLNCSANDDASNVEWEGNCKKFAGNKQPYDCRTTGINMLYRFYIERIASV